MTLLRLEDYHNSVVKCHDCGTDNTFTLSDLLKSYFYFCHSCQSDIELSHKVEEIREMEAIAREQ